MARIGATTYALEAMRRYTVGAIDKGIKPSVVTAMLKYYATELGRTVVNDGMDIMGGAGISLGHRNLIAEIYVATPIGITGGRRQHHDPHFDYLWSGRASRASLRLRGSKNFGSGRS